MAKSSFDRPNLSFIFRRRAGARADSSEFGRVVSVIREMCPQGQPTIVYVRSTKLCDELAEHLRSVGFAASSYHAKRGLDERSATHTAFSQAVTSVMVTVAVLFPCCSLA